MVTVRKERPAEAATREALLDRAYGPARFTKASERLREGRLPELALVASEDRRIVGTVRLWQVSAGPDRPALLFGPLAVVADRRKRASARRWCTTRCGRPHVAAMAPCCWSATRPITPGSVSPARRPARCGCPGLTSATGCLGMSSSRALSTAPVG